MSENWKYYNHMILPAAEPRQEINLDSSTRRALFKQFPRAYLIKYTTLLDHSTDTEWYFCIKDDAFSIENLKSKRRNVIHKGKKNFVVREFDPVEHIPEFQRIINDSNLGYSHEISVQDENAIRRRCMELSARTDSVFLGAFHVETEELVGYLWVRLNGKCIQLVEQHCIRAMERQECNAALVTRLCELYTEQYFPSGYYLCDGEKNVKHETHFQDYLEKYFGFRKAYCTLNVVYRPLFGLAVQCVYPVWPRISSFIRKHKRSVWESVNAVIQLEQILRKQKNETV